VDVDPRAKLEYDESVRGLEIQGRMVDELRVRAGVVLAAASLSSAFLGAAALTGQKHVPPLAIAALSVYFLALALCLCILFPSGDWEFVYSARTLDEKFYSVGVDATQMYRALSLGNADSVKVNRSQMGWRFVVFGLACLALGADVILWLIAVGLR
jgi:hypothetical protein